MRLGLHVVDDSRPGGPAQLGPMLAQITHAAEAVGFDVITKTCVLVLPAGEDGANPCELVGKLRGLEDLGIETVFLQQRPAGHITAIEAIGREVMPAVADR